MLYDIQRLLGQTSREFTRDADTSQDGYVQFPEFVRMLNVPRLAKLDQPRLLLRARLDEFRLWFSLFDADSGGSITLDEMQTVFHALGHKVSLGELQAMVGDVDENDNGQIDFVEFVTVLTSHSGGGAQAILGNTIGGLEELFRLFDAGGDGEISHDELIVVMRSLGLKPTDVEIQALSSCVDEDDDGSLSFIEFVRMMTGAVSRPELQVA